MPRIGHSPGKVAKKTHIARIHQRLGLLVIHQEQRPASYLCQGDRLAVDDHRETPRREQLLHDLQNKLA